MLQHNRNDHKLTFNQIRLILVAKSYENNRVLKDCVDYYDIITSEMVLKRTPPQVIPLGGPGYVVTNFMEHQSDIQFVVKWPEHAA